jgi:hypothetical protein
MRTMNGWLAVPAALAAATMLAACGGSGRAQPQVPSLSNGSSAVGSGGAGQGRAAALAAAAQCIRAHGIPRYQDPVLTPTGQVYTDSRSFEDATQATVIAAQHACRTQLARAGLHPDAEPPAPPQLVEAGVRVAECERAHGLPKVTDPTSRSPYTPGHGFGISASEAPPGGKQSPGFQEALHACRSLIDAEIRASTLGSLGSHV